ncbi:MAG: hypothetical protein EOO93_27690, partial [Pedobacter sp.]
MKVLKFIMVAFLLTSCHYYKYDDRNIEIINKSKKSVYAIISSNDSIKTLYYYDGFPNADGIYRFREIKPDSVARANAWPRLW